MELTKGPTISEAGAHRIGGKLATFSRISKTRPNLSYFSSDRMEVRIKVIPFAVAAATAAAFWWTRPSETSFNPFFQVRLKFNSHMDLSPL